MSSISDQVETGILEHIQHINKAYKEDKVTGFFYVTYVRTKKDEFRCNKHTFSEFFFLDQAIQFCKMQIWDRWGFEYGLVNILYVTIYVCYYEEGVKAVKKKEVVTGTLEKLIFAYCIL